VGAEACERAFGVFSVVAGGDTKTSTGDDAEASTGGSVGLMTSLIRFTPKTLGTSTKNFEVDLLRAETGSYPLLKRHRGSLAQTLSSRVLRLWL
jgi:hypothetical protein